MRRGERREVGLADRAQLDAFTDQHGRRVYGSWLGLRQKQARPSTGGSNGRIAFHISSAHRPAFQTADHRVGVVFWIEPLRPHAVA